MKMKVIKCDRCGAIESEHYESWCGVTVYIPNEGDAKGFDLCPSCKRDFAKWMGYISKKPSEVTCK